MQTLTLVQGSIRRIYYLKISLTKDSFNSKSQTFPNNQVLNIDKINLIILFTNSYQNLIRVSNLPTNKVETNSSLGKIP